jgi:hypothetical protein
MRSRLLVWARWAKTGFRESRVVEAPSQPDQRLEAGEGQLSAWQLNGTLHLQPGLICAILPW